MPTKARAVVATPNHTFQVSPTAIERIKTLLEKALRKGRRYSDWTLEMKAALVAGMREKLDIALQLFNDVLEGKISILSAWGMDPNIRNQSNILLTTAPV